MTLINQLVRACALRLHCTAVAYEAVSASVREDPVNENKSRQHQLATKDETSDCGPRAFRQPRMIKGRSR